MSQGSPLTGGNGSQAATHFQWNAGGRLQQKRLRPGVAALQDSKSEL